MPGKFGKDNPHLATPMIESPKMSGALHEVECFSSYGQSSEASTVQEYTLSEIESAKDARRRIGPSPKGVDHDDERFQLLDSWGREVGTATVSEGRKEHAGQSDAGGTEVPGLRGGEPCAVTELHNSTTGYGGDRSQDTDHSTAQQQEGRERDGGPKGKTDTSQPEKLETSHIARGVNLRRSPSFPQEVGILQRPANMSSSPSTRSAIPNSRLTINDWYHLECMTFETEVMAQLTSSVLTDLHEEFNDWLLIDTITAEGQEGGGQAVAKIDGGEGCEGAPTPGVSDAEGEEKEDGRRKKKKKQKKKKTEKKKKA